MGYNGPLPWLLLASKTASNSATISFTQIVSAYSSYVLVYSNVVPVTTGSDLQMVVSTNGGSTYISSGYLAGLPALAYNSSSVINTNSTSLIPIAHSVSTTSGAVGVIYLLNLQNGATFQITGTSTWVDEATVNPFSSLVIASNTATSVNAFQLAMSSGNISTGTFSLYGILE